MLWRLLSPVHLRNTQWNKDRVYSLTGNVIRGYTQCSLSHMRLRYHWGITNNFSFSVPLCVCICSVSYVPVIRCCRRSFFLFWSFWLWANVLLFFLLSKYCFAQLVDSWTHSKKTVRCLLFLMLETLLATSLVFFYNFHFTKLLPVIWCD